MTLLAALLAAAAVLLRWALPPEGRLRVAGLGPLPPRALPRPTLTPVPLAVLGGALALVAAGPVAALVGAGASAAGARVLASRRATAARAAERTRAVEACTALAAELRAGRSAAEALHAAQAVASGATRAALAAAAAAAAAGADVPGALLAQAHGPPGARSAVPELLRALAACWAVCASAGNGLAAAVERLEEGLRAAEAQRRAVEAELAGPRATAGLLAVLPVAGVVLATGLGADPLHVLLHTPVGIVCLLLGLALDGLGLLWTGRLVARAGGRR